MRLRTDLFVLLASAAGIALAAGPAAAQAQAGGDTGAQAPEATMEGVVVTAPRYVPSTTLSGTKTATPLIDTPQSITVVNRDQIDLLNEQNLGEAVRYTAGVDGEIFGDDPRYDWITVRGFYPIEYIDGLQAPVGSVSNSGVDLFGFDSVEILKGPSSTLYGLAPPGGIINLTSRRPQDSFGGELQALGGSYDNKQIAGDVTGPLGAGFDYRLTALYRDTDTQTDDVYERRFYIAPALSWAIDADTKLTFLSFYQRDKLMNDGGGFLPAYGTLLPNPNGMVPTSDNLGQRGYNLFNREQWGIGYDFVHRFDDHLSFEQNLKYFGSDAFTLSIYGAGLETGAGGLPTDFTTEERSNFPFKEHIRSFNVDNRLTESFDAGPVHNTLLVGLDYRNYTDRAEYGFSAAAPVDLYDPEATPATGVVTPPLGPYLDEQQAQTGLYVQEQARIGGLMITASGRQDWVDAYNGPINPSDEHSRDSRFTYRGGLNYVFANGVAPYVAYATSFQPTVGVNPDGSPFKPTTGDQVEGGVKFEPRFVPHDVKTLATAALFDLHQNNVAIPNPATDPPLTEQIGKVHVAGLELEDVTRISERLSINFAYSYLFTKASASERFGGPNTPAAEVGTFNPDPPLPMTPRNKASLLVDYTIPDGPLHGLGFGAGARYTGATFGDTAGEWRDPSVVLWDGLLHYNFDKWRLQVNATNLFDKTYVVQCSSFTQCYYGLRRNVIASLTRAF